jgi:hypothetical protein
MSVECMFRKDYVAIRENKKLISLTLGYLTVSNFKKLCFLIIYLFLNKKAKIQPVFKPPAIFAFSNINSVFF